MVDLHPFLIAFWRNLFCLILIIPIVYPSRAWRGPRSALPWHGLRAIANAGAMILLIAGLTTLPFAQAIALTFAAPGFVVIGGMLFLRERPGAGHLIGALLGFLGVALIAPPVRYEDIADSAWFSSGSALVLMSALLFAASNLISRVQTRHASDISILLYLYLGLTAVCLPLALSIWQWPDARMWLGLILIALASIAAHWSATIAIRLAQASKIAIFDYLRLLWAIMIGWFFFSESISITVLAGGFLIILAALMPKIFDARLKQH